MAHCPVLGVMDVMRQSVRQEWMLPSTGHLRYSELHMKRKSFIYCFPAVGTDSVQEIGDGIYLNVMKTEEAQGPTGHDGKQ